MHSLACLSDLEHIASVTFRQNDVAVLFGLGRGVKVLDCELLGGNSCAQLLFGRFSTKDFELKFLCCFI